ncbi:pre-B-cell leukemia homeobox interacting protein 1b isoform X2 [Myripristis murdjan]|uniref:Pre-B-cell leukemia homeobox interacting protein 1b n=1 Tax=Myripristis murdjan TaxID=586833 RepID=A0A667Z6R8_9TELE|nr:pre-B-cell leukemia transcription factor-interacting protein 1-like isoform X2 [Myripristis murdjan]
MSGGSGANNSWTILTSEESAAETLRPLTEHHEESNTSTAEHTGSGAESQPAEVAMSAVKDHQVSEDKTAEHSGDTSSGPSDHSMLTPAPAGNVTFPSTLDVSAHSVPGSDGLSQSEGLPEDPAPHSPDPDSFSDSYTHLSPSPDEPPASLLSTETLGGLELTEEEERHAQEEMLYPTNEEGLEQEGEESELSQRAADLGKQADSPVDSEVGQDRTEKEGEEGEPEVRRRRSLLAALERIGRREEEEEGEEEFQPPQREEDSGFSVNKCILGAVILLGLGTIFFSESDYGGREVRDAEVPVKQEWFNTEVPPPPADADNTELLNKLAKGNQQIAVLQAQLQAQKDELKVAKGQAAEGAKERLRREELEKENGRLKKEMASVPVLQKENERMKRELESVSALQKELETLRATVTELKLPTANEAAPETVHPTAAPPPGQAKDSRPAPAETTAAQHKKPQKEEKVEKKKEWKKEKYDMGDKEWKERVKSEWKGDKKERKEGSKMERKEKEWKKGEHEQVKYDQGKGKEGKKWRQSEDKKEWKERGDWKKDKASRGDEGKPWKDREGKKEFKEKGERKEWKEDKDWKKGKHVKLNDGKQWRGKEEKKEWKGRNDHGERHKDKEQWRGGNNHGEWHKSKEHLKEGKDHGEWHKGKEDWSGKKEWRKGKDAYKESDNERKGKWEKKDWKEKGEKNEWKRDIDRKSKNGKDQGKEWKEKDERKQWVKREWSKDGNWKEERNGGDWKKDRGNKHKGERKYSQQENHHNHHKEHVWQGPGDRKPSHVHHQPSLEEPDYWVHQRDRLQHNPRPTDSCDSVEMCAQAEGLLPVPLPEFEAILQSYLAKAEEAGVEASKSEELSKLATEFFRNGVFVHDQMSFRDFVEDVGDILEDMVEGDEDEGDEDSAIEEEMEGFEREVMDKFAVPGAGEREERKKGEWRKESARGRG